MALPLSVTVAPYDIKGVSFQLYSDNDIVKSSAIRGGATVSSSKFLEKYNLASDALSNIPQYIEGGLSDPRLGASNGQECAKCLDGGNCCITHPTYIDLQDEKFFHPQYYKQLCQILNCICLNCSQLLGKDNPIYAAELEDARNIYRRFRLHIVEHIVRKVKYCPCTPHKKIMKVKTAKGRKATIPDHYILHEYGKHIAKKYVARRDSIAIQEIIEEYHAAGLDPPSNRTIFEYLDVIKNNVPPAPSGAEQQKTRRRLLTLSGLKAYQLYHEIKNRLYAPKVFEILGKINQQDWDTIMGVSEYYKPTELILSKVPVPPRAVRLTRETDTITAENEMQIIMNNIMEKLESRASLREKKLKPVPPLKVLLDEINNKRIVTTTTEAAAAAPEQQQQQTGAATQKKRGRKRKEVVMFEQQQQILQQQQEQQQQQLPQYNPDDEVSKLLTSDIESVLFQNRCVLENMNKCRAQINLNICQILGGGRGGASATAVSKTTKVKTTVLLDESQFVLPPDVKDYFLHRGGDQQQLHLPQLALLDLDNENDIMNPGPYHLLTSSYWQQKQAFVQEIRIQNKYDSAGIIRSKLDGKLGLVRARISGKRVNKAARTVIAGNPEIDLDVVQIPLEFAMTLDYPVTVSHRNRDYLTRLVRNGPYTYPGANRILFRGNGGSHTDRIHRLRHASPSALENIVLRDGDIVFRHLLDYDYVLMNRQPTLHKDSIQGHRIKIGFGMTMEISVTATYPYNADFDGDEMNLHVPENCISTYEIQMLASIQRNLMSYGKAKTNYGLKFDALTGIYCIGADSDLGTVLLTKSEVMQILSQVSLSHVDIALRLRKLQKHQEHQKQQLFRPNVLISVLLPETLNFEFPGTNLRIVRGEVLSGHFSKPSIGTERESIINHIFSLYGNEVTFHVINNLQRVAVLYLLYRGMGLSLRDMKPPASILRKVQDEYRNLQIEVQKKLQQDPFYPEHKIFTDSMEIRNLMSKVFTKEWPDQRNNSMFIMSMFAKSKGKMINLTQISAALGQTELFYNCKLYRGTHHTCYGRSLPSHVMNNRDLSSNGCISNSFYSGLNLNEYFVHSASARVALINKGVGTAEPGDIQRRLIKCLEGILVEYDYTIRHAREQIIQFITATCGIEPGYMLEVPFPLLKLTVGEITERYAFTPGEIKALGITTSTSKKLVENLISFRDDMREFSLRHWNRQEIKNVFEVPFNFEEIVYIFKQTYAEQTTTTTTKKKKAVVKMSFREYELIMQDFKNSPEMNFVRVVGDDARFLAILHDIHSYHQRILWYFIKTYLHPREMCFTFTAEQFLKITLYIRNRHQFMKQAPGELTGILSSQSVGEPATQISLNSSHHAGNSTDSNSTNLGLPRLKKILRLTLKNNAPEMKLFFDEHVRTNQDYVTRVANLIQCLYLRDIIASSNIIYHVEPTDGSIWWCFEFHLLPSDRIPPFITPEMIKAAVENFLSSNQAFKKDNKKFKLKFQSILLQHFVELFWYKDDEGGEEFEDKMLNIYLQFKPVSMAVTAAAATATNSSTSTANTFRISYPYLVFLMESFEEFIKITGIQGISKTKVVAQSMVEASNNTSVTEYAIQTEGSNIRDALLLKHLDVTRIYSNDFEEMNSIFGIESVRRMLFDELRSIITSSEVVQPTHIAVLVDFICHRARLMNITSSKKSGVNTIHVDPLTRASFAEFTKNFLQAGLYCEYDSLKFLSSSTMTGQLGKFGTGIINTSYNPPGGLKHKTFEAADNSSKIWDLFNEKQN